LLRASVPKLRNDRCAWGNCRIGQFLGTYREITVLFMFLLEVPFQKSSFPSDALSGAAIIHAAIGVPGCVSNKTSCLFDGYCSAFIP
jgi:hypothetical protein